MRMITTFCLTAGFSDAAMAHTLPDESSLLQQLAHQLSGFHHLPLLVLLLAAGLLIYRRSRGFTRGQRKS